MWVKLNCVTFEAEKGPPMRQTAAGITPAATDKGRRQGLMRRLIASLPCQDPTCHSFLNKKATHLTSCKYFTSSQRQLYKTQTTCQPGHRWVSPCLSP